MTGIAAVEKLPVEENFYEKEFMEKITRPGPIKFVALLINDSYKGLDQVVKVEINVVEKSFDREEYHYLQEDLDLIKEKKDEDELDTADNSDPDAPEVELDENELERKLKRVGLEKTALAFKAQLETQRYNIKMKIKQPENPFIPELIKTM